MNTIYPLFIILFLSTLISVAQPTHIKTKFTKDTVYTIIERKGKPTLIYNNAVVYCDSTDILKMSFEGTKSNNYNLRHQYFDYYKLKPNVVLIPIEKVIELYHIDKSHKDCPILVDGIPMLPRDTKRYISKSHIRKVVIDTLNGYQFINIISTEPPPPGRRVL